MINSTLLRLQVIFISSDNDAAAFKAYFGTHPWTALPYADRTRAQRLMSKFGVRVLRM